MPLIYVALVLILGTIAIAIIVFTFVMIGSCANPPWSSVPRSTNPVGERSSSALLNLSPYLASSFKYRRGMEKAQAAGGTETECVVCLLRFEDDDEVRQLHGCKHSFHAPCIDMWMYSHSNCPLCRTPVDRRAALDFVSDDNSSSIDVLTDISITP
ncbi:hypothetical protein POUND7_003284 [Theobroma cacao]